MVQVGFEKLLQSRLGKLRTEENAVDELRRGQGRFHVSTVPEETRVKI